MQQTRNEPHLVVFWTCIKDTTQGNQDETIPAVAVGSSHIQDSLHNTCWDLEVEHIHHAPQAPVSIHSTAHHRRHRRPTGSDRTKIQNKNDIRNQIHAQGQ